MQDREGRVTIQHAHMAMHMKVVLFDEAKAATYREPQMR